MGIFDDVANALANVIGSDVGIAGFILGTIVIVVILVALVWALGEQLKGFAVIIPVGIAITFVVLVGWWPIWTIIFIAMLIALVIYKPFSEGEGI